MIIGMTCWVLGLLAGLGFGAAARKPPAVEPVDVDEAAMRSFEFHAGRPDDPVPRRTTEVLH